MTLSVYGHFLMTFACLLSSTILEVPGQGVPPEDACTPPAIRKCYSEYVGVLFSPMLAPDLEGNFMNIRFDLVCSEMNKKFACHKTVANCSKRAGMDLTRPEKGYQLMRDFVCDIELFKDFRKATACLDTEKFMGPNCGAPPGTMPPPYDPNGEWCRDTASEMSCREKSLPPDCSVPLSRRKSSFAKAGEAQALLMGCDYKASAAPSVAPHGFDVPSEEECTPQEIYGCYNLYYRVLREDELQPDQGGNFNNTAFHTACSAVKEKALCHKKIVKCPQKGGMDLTRQEKGYKLMRDFICDIELFKDFKKALPCEEHEKLVKCEPVVKHEEPPYDPNGPRCRSIINGWACREEAFNQSCLVPPGRVKEAFSKIGEAHALLMGCDYKSSAASSVAPQGFFFCLIIFCSLRWLQAL